MSRRAGDRIIVSLTVFKYQAERAQTYYPASSGFSRPDAEETTARRDLYWGGGDDCSDECQRILDLNIS